MSPRRIAKALAAFGAVALAGLLGVTIYVVKHRSALPSLGKVVGLVPGALLHAHNFHWTQMKSGEMQWVLTASDASYSGDKTAINLNHPVVTMESQDGKQVIVQAPRALLHMDKSGNRVQQADLTGGTIIHYGDLVVATDTAIFKPDADQVDAPGFVTITGAGFTVTGVGLTGHPKARHFELLQQVTTVVTPKPRAAASKKG